MEITSLKELQEMAKGEIVELTGFQEGVPFRVRVRKPSIMVLIQNNVIPNTLLSVTEEVFYGKDSSNKKNVDMDKMSQLMLIMAENVLVEPSLQQIREAGLELNDMQILELFNYSQRGVKGIESFRKTQQDTKYDSNSEAVQ
ncbi:esterase [Clostridium sp. DJ247]|uniref:esterase n=1 Tax=Clostridium sp. DJ247 TaxID=2726188 RepID=UPI0016275FDC|nr:esterase [Clostridium sp. DJ247]MBC2579995.1 esterase [Clostridium sp. DJ247]